MIRSSLPTIDVTNILPPDTSVGVRQVSLHPPHLTDSRGNFTPAAFIPFCAYQTNMSSLGETIDHLSFSYCTKFQPAVLDGQLCYSLDLEDVLEEQTETKPGKKYGILIILDPGRTDKDQHRTEVPDNDETIESLNLQTEQVDEESTVKVHIATLARFTDYGPGSYVMSALKKMTGTNSFLAFPEDEKFCQTERFESCQERRHIEHVESRCGCVPWTVSSGLALQVTWWILHLHDCLHLSRITTSALRSSPPASGRPPLSRLTAGSPALDCMQT